MRLTARKTSSLVIDSLCDRAGKEDIAVAGLYCDFLSQQDQTVSNIMGAILGQLVGRGDIPSYLREAYQKAKKEFGGRRPQLADLMGMLRTTIASLPRVFICIDALDECLPKFLPDILGCLKDISRGSPTTRIFFTGRPHVREDIQRYFTKAAVIPISPNRGDIRNYLEMRIDRDAEPEAMNIDLRADIIRVILENISDMCVEPFRISTPINNIYSPTILYRFLLVSLNIDAILGEVTIRQRRKKLEEMAQGGGLSDAYTATLRRLKSQKGNKSALGLKVLMWVLYSERPLRAHELCHALGVEIGSTDLDPENVPALRTLISSCLGLVTVEESSSTVRLVHFTLQEHLSSDPTLFHSPHSIIAEVCLTYLNFGCIRNLAPTLHSAPETTPLLEYACINWGRHTRRGMTENILILALRVLDEFDKHIPAQLLLLHNNQYHDWSPYFDGAGGPTGFTGLHGAAFLGVVGAVPSLLGMNKWDVNAADCTGITSLIWAVVRGHEEVVRMLLEREDVNPDQPDSKYGRTPLSWAAEKGHDGIVKMLLAREEVNPDHADTEYGVTPLWWAAKNGHDGIVTMLLEREDINLDQPDTCYGWTPLSFAAKNGHDGIVKMLLERENVNPDHPDTQYGQTPLSLAAENGYDGIVNMLLEREGVNPDQADTKYGRTPLSLAANNGHDRIVKMLLEREDINPDQPDTEDGRTPLSLAAENGHYGIVKMLLERKNVNPNQQDTKSGLALLPWAAENGHDEIVKILLEREDVNPDQPDTIYGQTPFSFAAANGHDGIVSMLLEQEDVNPDQPDTSGQTPLSLAAKNGHGGIVKMLLDRENVNPNQQDNYCRTPLSRAAENGHDRIVKMLLERENVNPDQPDNFRRTPLSLAAENGHDEMVKILLEQKNVNPDQLDTFFGRTPLLWAAKNGHGGIVRMLLERDDVNPDRPDTAYGRTPLAWAAENEHDGIVKMLLAREDVNPDQLDSDLLAQSSWWPHFSPRPLKLRHPPWKLDAHPNAQIILSCPVGRSFIIASLIFAFLLYIFPRVIYNLSTFMFSSLCLFLRLGFSLGLVLLRCYCSFLFFLTTVFVLGFVGSGV